MLGNKLDLVKNDPSLREVEPEEAQQLAEDNGFLFLETSALSTFNIKPSFEVLLNAVMDVRRRMQTPGYNTE